MAETKELRLHRAMRLRGVFLSQPIDPAAARRCLECRMSGLCDEALAAGQADALRLFCPNTHYVEALRPRGLEF